jgi:hypothetical protein
MPCHNAIGHWIGHRSRAGHRLIKSKVQGIHQKIHGKIMRQKGITKRVGRIFTRMTDVPICPFPISISRLK